MMAVAVALVIELIIGLAYRPGFWQRSTYVLHDPYRGEPFDRAELAIRLSHLGDMDPDIISVGDSSGFFSLQSTIVNRYLGGRKFLSLNTGANHAYDGYYAIARYMLQRSPHLKYVVLYVFPLLLPVKGVLDDADLGPILHRELVSPKAYLIPPSAFAAPYAKFMMFEGRRFHAGDPLSGSLPVLQLTHTVDTALGWLPEFDVRYDRINGESRFFPDVRSGLMRLVDGEPSSIVAHLTDFNNMVRSYGARLVIAFAPLPQRFISADDVEGAATDSTIARFQQQHPEVKFLFPLRTPWSPEKFGTSNHISREYTFLSSRRLGEGLARLINEGEKFPLYVPEAAGARAPYPRISIKPNGPPDPKLLDAALALYRYTTTTDEADRSRLSRRVYEGLDREPSFGFMLTDAKARAVALAEQKIKLGVDQSQLRAMPVTVEGLTHCSPHPDLQWVQVYGTMNLTFDSLALHLKEPVIWPHQSGILFPILVENGEPRYDGYCAEPSPADGASAKSPM